MLYVILLHTQFRHPGAPKPSNLTQSGVVCVCVCVCNDVHYCICTANLPTVLPDSDISSITLALQTLGSFNFGG